MEVGSLYMVPRGVREGDMQEEGVAKGGGKEETSFSLAGLMLYIISVMV